MYDRDKYNILNVFANTICIFVELYYSLELKWRDKTTRFQLANRKRLAEIQFLVFNIAFYLDYKRFWFCGRQTSKE